MNDCNLYELAKKLPDKGVENKIARILREHHKDDAYEFIERLITSDELKLRKSGLSLIARCLNDQTILLSALEVGLKRYDISEIGLWFRSIVPRLGVLQVLSFSN